MKNLLFALIVTVSLYGCALTQPYDNNEYSMLTYIIVSAEELQELCNADGILVQKQLPLLRKQARAFELYTEYTPNNKEVHTTAQILVNDIYELEKQYNTKKHSPTYCKIKTRLFAKKAVRMLEAIGQKIRN